MSCRSPIDGECQLQMGTRSALADARPTSTTKHLLCRQFAASANGPGRLNSIDDSRRLNEKRLRYLQSKCGRGFAINHQIDLRWLLNG